MNDPILQAYNLRGRRSQERVMLIMPPGVAGSGNPQLGLGILASRLKQAGCSVCVADYSYSSTLPSIEELLSSYEPNAIGVTVFSQHLAHTKAFLKELNETRTETPIVLGGPHITLSDDRGIEGLYLSGVKMAVRGEADDEIEDIMRTVHTTDSPKIVVCDEFELKHYIIPDFSLFLNGDNLLTYPMQLSRGCPFECIFCNVKELSGRKYRIRDINGCIEEIRGATSRYPNLEYIKITDDSPNCIPNRMEQFIDMYVGNGFRAKLEVMQLRADKLTLETCKLLKLANAPCIVLGVESGDERVFSRVKKGETLEQIRRACNYVTSCGIPLVLCFVVGLPGATVESDKLSISFAREMKATHCYWNLAQPVIRTEMFDYFKTHGRIYSDNVMEESTLEGGCFADTPEYPAIERLRMQVRAQASTNEITQYTYDYYLRHASALGIESEVRMLLDLPRPVIQENVARRW